MKRFVLLLSALAVVSHLTAIAQNPSVIPNGDSWVKWDQSTRDQYILCFTFGYVEGLSHAKLLVTGSTQAIQDFTTKTAHVSVPQISSALDEIYADFENRVIVITKAITLANFLAAGVYDREYYKKMINLWREKSLKGEYY